MKRPEAIAAASAVGSAVLTSLCWWFGHDVVHAGKLSAARESGVSAGRKMEAEAANKIIANQADEIDGLRATVEQLSGIYIAPAGTRGTR